MTKQKLPIEKVDRIVREAKRYARMMNVDFDEQRFRRDHQRYHVIDPEDL
jgi:hypothetical protein